jgi:hypothetical protein
MRLKTRLCLESVALVAVAALLGCEWEGAGGGDTWNERFSWVNFSGVYKGALAGVLVTDYSSSLGEIGATGAVFTATETVGTAVAGQSLYSGTVRNSPLVAGGFQVTVGVFALHDDGTGQLTGSGKTGSVDYGTGAWTLDLLGEWPPAGSPIVVSYNYSSTGSGGAASEEDAGTSGIVIYSFVVDHTGNLLHITDNNGSVYQGKLSSVRTTGNFSQDSTVQTPLAGEQVIASFTASGVSAAGMHVTMVGTFQGVVQGGALPGTTGGAASTSLADRRMLGTWIEKNGKTGNINGYAAPIGLNTTVETGQDQGGTNMFIVL